MLTIVLREETPTDRDYGMLISIIAIIAEDYGLALESIKCDKPIEDTTALRKLSPSQLGIPTRAEPPRRESGNNDQQKAANARM